MTLMSMAILTTLGLALVVSSGIERDLSTNSRAIERTFYAADSGVAIATAQILHSQKTDPSTHVVEDQRGASTQLTDEITVSRSVPIQEQPCDLCQINIGEATFFSINHAMNSTAIQRGKGVGAGDVPMAQASVGAMLQIQPWMRMTTSLPTSSDEIKAVRH